MEQQSEKHSSTVVLVQVSVQPMSISLNSPTAPAAPGYQRHLASVSEGERGERGERGGWSRCRCPPFSGALRTIGIPCLHQHLKTDREQIHQSSIATSSRITTQTWSESRLFARIVTILRASRLFCAANRDYFAPVETILHESRQSHVIHSTLQYVWCNLLPGQCLSFGIVSPRKST